GTGRPPLQLSLNPDLARVVGVLFEHTHVRGIVADLGLRRLADDLRMMDVSADPRAALASAAEMVETLVRSSAATRDRILGVGMALAARVDLPTGTVRPTRALRGWVDLQPGSDLERRLRLPVRVDNDATLAGFGEAVTGAARGSRHS